METRQSLNVLSALAQETRLEIYRLLVRHEPAGMPAGDIAGRLSVPPSTLSSHLGILAHAGLIRGQREGKAIRYFAQVEAVAGLIDFLVADCCGGRPEQCRPLLRQLPKDLCPS